MRAGSAAAAHAQWRAGRGAIVHRRDTATRVARLVTGTPHRLLAVSEARAWSLLCAADVLCNAGLWLTAHMTYAHTVDLSGRDLAAGDFKENPEGHTGGSLNMIPAYTGYLLANALSGHTRGWMMGQGHCVAAVDAMNLIADNMSAAHAARYGWNNAGLTRLVRDFYSYALDGTGHQDSPLGSHVNPHTAGGISEGGYLGFAELMFVHTPLPGERLVAFLSDGAFEEQRGGDWAPRWWRPEDCGLVAPLLIANGRRIDQRTTLTQQGGPKWFAGYMLSLGFEPVFFDGRDPAAFAWAILTLEDRLARLGEDARRGRRGLPVPLPYGVAMAPKGWGFAGAGTPRAHNLPLPGNPRSHERSRSLFHRSARRLFRPTGEVLAARREFHNHRETGRARERDHAMARRKPARPRLPAPGWRRPGATFSAMEAADGFVAALCRANRGLRVRVGNPDELKSNHMEQTLRLLKHRVTQVEDPEIESTAGAVITALNEEAVACAALANKGGLNLIVTYEAFAPKMQGALRQEILFARHQREQGKDPGWLSVPVLLTSHTWENGKNEQSHQDPALAEFFLGEMADTARAVFPADANAMLAALAEAWRTRGTIFGIVAPKRATPVWLGAAQAKEAVRDGVCILRKERRRNARLLLAAAGAYQVTETMRASDRLHARGLDHRVVVIHEPGRLRDGRDARETEFTLAARLRSRFFPAGMDRRVFVSHTRPAALVGALRSLDTGPGRTACLGYLNQGGTLDLNGLLYRNRCTWAHVVAEAARVAGLPATRFLTPAERAALAGRRHPDVLWREP